LRDENHLRQRRSTNGPEAGPPPDDEIVISLDELLRVLWRRAWIIALVAGLLTAAAAGFSLLRTPIYEASIQIVIGQREGAAPTNLGSDVMGLQQLTRTMAEVLESRTVANAVIREMNLPTDAETFLENMTVEPVTETQVIEVSYRDPEPERAQQVANTIGRVFSEQVSDLSPSANAVTATVWERAQLPDEPVSPQPLRNAAIALVLGLMLGTGAAFLVEHLDDRWRSPEDAEQVSGVPTFGVVRQFDTSGGKRRRGRLLRRRGDKKEDMLDLAGRLVTLVDQDGLAAEDYRSLRTNLFYAFVDAPPRAIVTTSPGPREGKSTTCANLGVALAQAGRSTLLLDCDLRKPVVHEIFGLRNIRGVVDVLAGTRELREVWHSPVPNLRVVPTGPIPPNPAELLSSRRFQQMLEEARGQFDYVLMDAPPVEAVSDPVILATHSDGVLLVIDAQNTRKGAVRRAMRSLEAVGARVLGTVLNNAGETEGGYYYYYRRYGY